MNKVLLVIDQIKSGGAEKILLDFNQYLLDHNYTTQIHALYDEPSRNSQNFLEKLKQQINQYYELKKICRQFSPDVVFSFLDRSNVIVSMLAGSFVRILTVHNILSIQYRKLPDCLQWIVRQIIRYTYNRKRQSVVAVSNMVRDDLQDSFGVKKNIEVINNYVDKDKLIRSSNERITEIDLKSETKYILNVGRFTIQKAQWKIIKAIAYIQLKYNRKVALILLGEGELKAQLQALSENLGVADRIAILPFNPNPYKFMSKCDMFVLPSLYEGAPIVLSEIIALERPFIGSSKAVPRELFGDNETAYDQSTFVNTHIEPDFSEQIYDDDMLLGDKIFNVLFESKDQSVLGCQSWNKKNYKSTQFNEYLKLFKA